MLMALGAVAAFLTVLGLVTFALTDTSGIEQDVPVKMETAPIVPEG